MKFRAIEGRSFYYYYYFFFYFPKQIFSLSDLNYDISLAEILTNFDWIQHWPKIRYSNSSTLISTFTFYIFEYISTLIIVILCFAKLEQFENPHCFVAFNISLLR